ncbi:hypothetical protein SADUNF_Sadunf17G0003700 [Salix dunnii]|uniref:Protein kinase domain-containing protein n=1 Tax=Salix dunnii TaxID=1413687 RepID=A0A835J407_9ROSI|nr:hypothetical protein SADUNF_Sadunf17G0003700 [Salix dunnii]
MANLLFISSFMSLLATLTVTTATETDIYCLKSIKDSVIDPYGFLNTMWGFSNATEGFICRFVGVECWHPDENRLIGHIPPQIGQLDRIKVFSVANNQLSGSLPNLFRTVFSYDSFANNAGLCGKPLKNCSSHQQKFEHSFKGGFVIGYIVFSVSVAICFTSYCVPWVYAGERKKKITILGMMMLMRRRKHKITEDDQAGSSLLEEETKEVSMLEKRVTRMGYADLNDATDNFSEKYVIGQGKVGILYKASLPNGYVLAVKKLHDFQFLEEQFISELKILGSLRHINLLPLLGFCIEQNQRFLVYKYMPNGNLYDWLHPKEESPEKVMDWGVRVKIAIGLARGLAWIHHNCHTVRVIHLDISSKCILLDRNFQPKLSNFGEAILMRSTCTSSVNSELWEMAFVKEDVHGFGVVFLELITRVDPRNMTDSSNNILNEWTDHLLSRSSSYGAIDKSLIGQGFDEEIFQLLKVACRCVDPNPDRRPIMLQVYEDIKAIRERCDLADDSENLMRPEICPTTTLTVSAATATDIYCLKSIKNSVIDPYGHLNSSWNFDNTTEGFICGFLGIECWHPNENRVLNIRLPDLGLEGQFPLGLENCTSLTGLNFSHNKLQGPIPSDISERLAYITDLDLSYNNFSGEIPSDIANCSFLNSLRLDHNQLTGNIPAQIGFLERLEIFSVADNLLSGPVPNFVKANVNYANNPGLCGGPLDPCKGHSDEFHSSFRTGFAAGCMFFSVSVIVGFLSHCAPWVDVRKRTAIQTMVMLIFRKNRIEADNLSGSPSAESIHGGGKEGLTIYDFVHVKKRIERQIMVMLISRKNRIEADNLSGSPSAESIDGGKEGLTISDFVHVKF